MSNSVLYVSLVNNQKGVTPWALFSIIAFPVLNRRYVSQQVHDH